MEKFETIYPKVKLKFNELYETIDYAKFNFLANGLNDLQ